MIWLTIKRPDTVFAAILPSRLHSDVHFLGVRLGLLTGSRAEFVVLVDNGSNIIGMSHYMVSSVSMMELCEVLSRFSTGENNLGDR